MIITGIIGLLLNDIAQSASLKKVGKKVLLTKAGDGLWDLKVLRRPDGSIYGMPSGEAVDNDGHIYLCDTFGNRILVFTSEGKHWKIITHKDLYHPRDIKVGEDNTLFITSVIRGKGEDIQFIVSLEGTNWIFRSLEKVKIAVADTDKIRVDSGQVLPFGKNGLRYVKSTESIDMPLQLVDENNEYVKLVPSRFFDKKGRYYKSIKGEMRHGLYDETGKLLGEFTPSGLQRIKYNGWIYFVEKLNGKWSLLRRYGEDESVEHEIILDEELLRAGLLISPNNKYVLLITALFPDGMWITRLTYQED